MKLLLETGDPTVTDDVGGIETEELLHATSVTEPAGGERWRAKRDVRRGREGTKDDGRRGSIVVPQDSLLAAVLPTGV